MKLYVTNCTCMYQIKAKCMTYTIKLFCKVIMNISVFTNKMQRVSHVREIDKNFQAMFSLSFFLKLIYFIKALLLYISRKNTLIASIYSLRHLTSAC